jgi:hypothetical protein
MNINKKFYNDYVVKVNDVFQSTFPTSTIGNGLTNVNLSDFDNTVSTLLLYLTEADIALLTDSKHTVLKLTDVLTYQNVAIVPEITINETGSVVYEINKNCFYGNFNLDNPEDPEINKTESLVVNVAPKVHTNPYLVTGYFTSINTNDISIDRSKAFSLIEIGTSEFPKEFLVSDTVIEEGTILGTTNFGLYQNTFSFFGEEDFKTIPVNPKIFSNCQKLINFRTSGEENLGISTAIFGNNLVVGSDGADTVLETGEVIADMGKALLYKFNDQGKIYSQTTLEAPDRAADDLFGFTVAINDSRIVVGSHADNTDTGTDSGSAYIFDIDGNYITKIIAPDGAGGDRYGNTPDQFGYSVAINDSRIVVGSLYNDAKGKDSGAAYIFDIDGNYITKIAAPDGVGGGYKEVGDLFGYSIAISDSKIVVGAHADDDKGGNSGSAYIFDTDGNYITKIVAPDGTTSDYFGNSVAISDSKIVVAAHYDDDTGTNSGSVYIFDMSYIDYKGKLEGNLV